MKTGIDDKELKNAIKKLKALGQLFPVKERKKFLTKAAKPLRDAARANISDSDDTHFRYKTAKLEAGKKAPKGSGNVIAAYVPGNLRKSIKFKNFRRSAAMFIGPVTSKTGSGIFGQGARVDGYYAHYLEFGTKYYSGIGYMRRAVDATKGIVTKNIINESEKIIDSYLKKEALK